MALISTWLGVNAIWGLSSSSHTVVSGVLARLGRLDTIVAFFFALLILAAFVTHRSRIAFSELMTMLLAFLVGTALSRHTQAIAPLDSLGGGWLQTLAHRSLLPVTALPMLAVYAWTRQSDDLPTLRLGTWTRRSRLFPDDDVPKAWSRYFGYFALAIVIPLGLLMQASVGFRPLTSGALWPALAPLSALALLNSVSEELLFRGLLLVPLVRLLGVGPGIWAQGIFFGIHHLGSSPGPVATLVSTGATVMLGVLWGRRVVETRGIGWAIAAHALVDLAFFSAHFVDVP